MSEPGVKVGKAFMMEPTTKWASELREMRIAADKSQKQLGCEIGFKSGAGLCAVELGKTTLTFDVAKRWAEACGYEFKPVFIKKREKPEPEHEPVQPPVSEAVLDRFQNSKAELAESPKNEIRRRRNDLESAFALVSEVGTGIIAPAETQEYWRGVLVGLDEAEAVVDRIERI